MSIALPGLAPIEVGEATLLLKPDITEDDFLAATDAIVAISEAERHRDLQDRLAAGIVATCAITTGLHQNVAGELIARGERFSTALIGSPRNLLLHRVKVGGVVLTYPPSRSPFFTVQKGDVTHEVFSPDEKVADKSKNVALIVIDALATLIHQTNPDFGIDNQIDKRSSDLLSKLVSLPS
jgi:hypothetical protein